MSGLSVRSITLFLGLAIQQFANAGTVSQATITNVIAQEANAVMVFTNVPVTHPAACGAANPRFAIDPSTPGGKAILATVFFAQAMGRKVDIVGRGEFPQNFTNFCNVWPDTESINYIDLAQ